MKYRLKDQALQKRLDEVTGGNFSHRLQDPDFVERMEFKSSEKAAVTLLLLKTEIEPIPEYTTKGWNPFPEVTPPEGVLMRVETTTGSKFCGYYHTFAEGGCWCYEDGTVCPEAISKSVKRYRPWED